MERRLAAGAAGALGRRGPGVDEREARGRRPRDLGEPRVVLERVEVARHEGHAVAVESRRRVVAQERRGSNPRLIGRVVEVRVDHGEAFAAGRRENGPRRDARERGAPGLGAGFGRRRAQPVVAGREELDGARVVQDARGLVLVAPVADAAAADAAPRAAERRDELVALPAEALLRADDGRAGDLHGPRHAPPPLGPCAAGTGVAAVDRRPARRRPNVVAHDRDRLRRRAQRQLQQQPGAHRGEMHAISKPCHFAKSLRKLAKVEASTRHGPAFDITTPRAAAAAAAAGWGAARRRTGRRRRAGGTGRSRRGAAAAAGSRSTCSASTCSR